MVNLNGTTAKPGRQLLPVVVDERDPKWIFARVPKSSTTLQDGLIDVTCGAFARAVNRAAGWLEDRFGRSTSFDTLAYIGPSDIRYGIFFLAATKLGYKTLLPSPRNSLEGQLALFKVTDCKALLTPKGYQIQTSLLEKSAIPHHEVQDTFELLAEGQVRKYKFTKSWEEAKNEPLLVLHTSGSTGLPKPIVLTHGWMSAFDANRLISPFEAQAPIWTAFKAKTIFSSLPPFHGFGLGASFLFPLFADSESIVVWPPTGRPMNTVTIDELLESTRLEVAIVAPSLLEELVQLPESLARLGNIKKIVTGGGKYDDDFQRGLADINYLPIGPLSKNAADTLSEKSLVINVMGATEIGILPSWIPPAGECQYFLFNPEFKGVELRYVEDDIYQLFLTREPFTDAFHGTWYTFPNAKEYTMNDLYKKHPTKKNLWLYAGRADDVIVLSNGEKLNPTSMELILLGHMGVTGALVVGQAKFAPAVIIELEDEISRKVEGKKEREALLDAFWPLVVEANKSAPAHAQIARDKIIFNNPEKRFLRVAKGTIRRKPTTKLYEKEIDELYEDENKDGLEDIPQINLEQDTAAIEGAIGSLFAAVIGVEKISPAQDIFSLGIDSLQVIKVSRQLEAAFGGKKRADSIARMIYSNSTVGSLTTALKDNPGGKAGVTSEVSMLQTLDRFKKQLPLAGGLVVILTGSTGSLGSYLLDALASAPNVKKIYCLNRRVDASEHQARTNATRGLISEWGGRVVFFHADLSKPKLGLKEQEYDTLRAEVGAIIHNQWQVNFNLGLKSFEAHIAGALSLIELSCESAKLPPIFFTSSIGTLGNWATEHPGKPVPEAALDDPSISTEQGYSESKWITERLLDAAREKSGVSSAIIRVGQIAGPVHVPQGKSGVWNKQEWLPSIIQSSKYLKLLPNSLGTQDSVTWVPVNILASIIVELVTDDCPPNRAADAKAWTKYYHLENPHVGKWSSLVSVIQQHFSKEKLQVVGLGEWVDKLEASGKAPDADPSQNPGLKLLGMFQGLKQASESVIMDTTKTCEKSKIMQSLPAVNEDWMRLWLEQWSF